MFLKPTWHVFLFFYDNVIVNFLKKEVNKLYRDDYYCITHGVSM